MTSGLTGGGLGGTELALPVCIVSSGARNAGFRVRAVGVARRDAELLNRGKVEILSFTRADFFALLLLMLIGRLHQFSFHRLRAALLRLRPIKRIHILRMRSW